MPAMNTNRNTTSSANFLRDRFISSLRLSWMGMGDGGSVAGRGLEPLPGGFDRAGSAARELLLELFLALGRSRLVELLAVGVLLHLADELEDLGGALAGALVLGHRFPG